MSDPIRMLHFADVHIGMENYGRIDPTTGTSTRVRDFLDRLDEVIDYAIEHEADLAVFAGDAFKDRNPEPTQQTGIRPAHQAPGRSHAHVIAGGQSRHAGDGG